MINLPKVRMTPPKESNGQIIRTELIDAALGHEEKLVYVYAGAGYGKTTLLAQIANSIENSVWLTLDGEGDVLTFADNLCAAVRFRFPFFDLTTSEYLPFEAKDEFITILANALISSLEKLETDLTVFLDDIHTIENQQIRKLIATIVKYKPANIRLFFSSREFPWPELVPHRIRGNMLEITQNELKFSRDEASRVLGSYDEKVYTMAEGWPLAIGSFRVLLETGVSSRDIPLQFKEALYTYLLYECVSRQPVEIVDFLKTSACFEDLDVHMLEAVLDQKNTRPILESLVSRNIFTIKTSSGQYRYHALFREYLLTSAADLPKLSLLKKAALYYYKAGEYAQAAKYAISAEDKELLQRIIVVSYKDYLKSGQFNELRPWFQALGEAGPDYNQEILVAKGAFYSSIGNFNEAKRCLDQVIPQLKRDNQELYIEAMVHKARVLRNFISFEESTQLLDELLTGIDDYDAELLYPVIIEKIYNLCWNSQVIEAYTVACQAIEKCSRIGNLKVKAWFERFLTAIHFFAGRMQDAVYYYEQSLTLPENERRYLDMHSVGMYAAKAYQMLGDQTKAVSTITTELHKLRSAGRYEELWAAYLLTAEIYYQISDQMNGDSEALAVSAKYYTLADEYAPLYRTTEFQTRWTRIHRLINSLLFSSQPKEPVIADILANFDHIGDFFKTIVLGRIFQYYINVGNMPQAIMYAKQSIEIGEKSGIMMIGVIAYGLLAILALVKQDKDQALLLITKYMELCRDYGIYDYFRKPRYDPILKFADKNNITPEFTKKMIEFSGRILKKVYVRTIGGLSVYPANSPEKPIKMRTKKERELLAFLLEAGSCGATKESIIEALWFDSESEHIKKLIGVHLAQLKQDLASLGVENPVVYSGKSYMISRDEIDVDIDMLESAIVSFTQSNDIQAAQKIISLYKGEYLTGFEALWAMAKRLKYRKAYEEAVSFCEKNSF